MSTLQKLDMHQYTRGSCRDLGVSSTGEAPVVAVVTGSVLQTEAGLVALGHHMVRVGIQQVVVAELIHAVEVSVDQSSRSQSNEESRHIVCLLRQKQSGF